MEEIDPLPKSSYCYSCLCNSNKNLCLPYQLQTETLKTIFQASQIILCFLCKRTAQHVELFIQNVQSNQILLENLDVITETTIQTIKSSAYLINNLTEIALPSIQLDNNDSGNDEKLVVYNSKKDVKVKLEFKCEDDTVDDNDNEFNELLENENKLQFRDLDTAIKEEEDEYPLKLLKQELELEGINIKIRRKSSKKPKLRKKVRVQTEAGTEEDFKIPEARIEVLHLTRKECMQERSAKLLEDAYVNSEYKCEDCIKYFSYKSSYENHMEKHNEKNGDYVCDICKQRMSTEDKLLYHQRYHTLRFKCLDCGLTRLNRLTIEDHFRAKHCSGLQFGCLKCYKTFSRKTSLRKHVNQVHKHKQKVECDHCNKVYASKETLKAHVIRRHSDPTMKRIKKHICQVCGMAFANPSQLKNHGIKHSVSRDFYCVECDKSFKSDYILKHHLKTAKSHNSYKDLPLSCLHCKKRFAIRRDLDRHMNRVHLNIKPYQCDQCEKAYINNWSLKEHRRLAHEGYKRPLRYPCSMCDKVFDRNHILKSHIRTHTGERPYQCRKCPAAFSQAGILGTHIKLVHLKLTRDGRPKANSVGLGVK